MFKLAINKRWGNVLFSLFTLLIATAIFLGAYLELDSLFVIPATALFAYFALFDFKKLYYLLILALPITLEKELPGGLSIDIPGEPVLITFLMIFIFYLLTKRKYNPEFIKTPLIQILFVHLTWIFVTIFFSYEILISLKFFLSKIWHVVTFVFITGLFIKKVKDFRILFWCVLIPTVFTILMIVAKHSATAFSFEDINSSSGLFYRNHVNYAAFISLLMPFIWLATSWYKQGTIPRYFLLFSKILFLFAIYVAFSRGAWLALIASVVFYYALKLRMVKYLIIPLLAAFLWFGNFMITENNYLNYAPEFGKAIYHGNIVDHLKATIQNQDVSTAERFYRWASGLHMSAENPVTGFGPGSFYHYYRYYTVTAFTTYVSDNPEKSGVHNYFLMTLIEQGFIGLLIFLSLTFAIFYYGIKTYHRISERSNKQFIAAILCSFVIIYVQLFLSDLVETIKIGGFFFINLALLANQMLLQKEKSEETATQ